MAIVSVNRTDRNRTARWANSGWEATDSYVVVTDDPSGDTASEVVRASDGTTSIPFKDDQHPEIPILFADEIYAVQRPASMRVWDVYVEFRQIEIPLTQSPLDDPVQLRWTTVKTQEPYTFDLDGTPVANSAGVPFDPPPVRDVSRLALVAIRNEPSFSVSEFVPFMDGVNQSTFFGAQPGQVKLTGMSGEGPRTRNGIDYWVVTYEFHFHRDPWDTVKLLDQGLDELVVCDGADGTTRIELLPILRKVVERPAQIENQQDLCGLIMGSQSIPVSEPVPLNGEGRYLPPRNENGNPNEPFYLTLRRYPRVNFDNLPFGSLETPITV